MVRRTIKALIGFSTALAASGPIFLTPGANATVRSQGDAAVIAPAKVAGLGSTIAIHGRAGTSANITLVKIIDPAQPTESSSRVKGVLVGIEMRIVGTGSNLFPSGDAVLNVSVTDSNRRAYDSVSVTASYFGDLRGCKNFANGLSDLAKGKSLVGCVIFALASTAKVVTVRYDLPGGSTGSWQVR